MRVLSITAAAALLASALGASAQTPSSYERLYDALWSTVNDNYYDPHFRGADWAGQRERYRARAQTVRTDAQFLALANEMLREIPSSHLHVSAPSPAVGGAGVGARFAEMGGGLIVAEVAPLSDAYRQGLRPGDKLLSERATLRGELSSRAAVRIQTCEGGRRTLGIRREHAFWTPEHPGFRWSQIRTGQNQRVGYMRIDRGDLSYPIYMTQLFVIGFVLTKEPPFGMLIGIFGTIAMSVVILLVIDHPLDRWRQRRVHARREPSAAPGAASVAPL